MKSTPVSVGLIIGALLVSTGAGWLAGRSSIRADDRQSAPTVSHSSKSPAARASQRSGKADAQPAAAAVRRRSLGILLATANHHLLGGAPDNSGKIRAAARISLIKPEDIPAALEIVAELDGGLYRHRRLAALLLERWAIHDGPAACDFALKEMPAPSMGLHPVSDPLRAWASIDPAAAMAWFQEHKSPSGQVDTRDKILGSWAPISSIRWIVGAWALSDSGAVAKLYRELGTAQERSGARTGLTELAAKAQHRSALLDAIWETPDNPDKPQSPTYHVHRILERWAKHDPAELAEWVDGRGIRKSSDFMMSKEVLGHWLLADQDAAIDWWLNREGGHPGLDNKLGNLLKAWSEYDIFSAAEWLSAQELTEDHARAVRNLSSKLAQTDPARAFAWANAVPTDWARDRALAAALKSWIKKAPDAARSALATAELSDETRTKLEAIANPEPEPEIEP